MGKFLKKLGKKMQLPEEALGSLRIIMIKNEKAVFENHKGIGVFTSESAEIKAEGALICVFGKELFLKCISDDEAHIEGKISGIEFKGHDAGE